ncbi:MAG TPA: hypothetical protein VMS17_24485 [Gemmataceae bacterium]|nr:hypothetical protein [Gemmataceae bacterium]
MSLRRLCALVGFCAVLWTSGCCFDHCACRRHERDCGCSCPCECGYGPSDYHAGPPMAPSVVVPPAAPVIAGGGH